MATSTAPSLGAVTSAVRERARAEAREVTAMLDYRDAEAARTASVEPPMKAFLERSAIPMSIGEATGLSEGQVQGRLSMADTVRDHSPTTWAAFTDGRIDLARVRDIAHTIDQLKRPESVHRLDHLVVAYATCHTAAELRQWLRRFVQRVEADLAVERAEDARADRHVRVTQGDDSMADLHAHVPSHEAAAIAARLRREARKTPETGPDPHDGRTLAQREADLLVAWCLSTGSRGGAEAATSAVDAAIAVTVDADVLAGAAPGFVESTDGTWAVPADWVVKATSSGNTFWHRMVVEPVTGDVLSFEYAGRYAPDTLKTALMFLHGTCQAPGCMIPAGLCDHDHRVPHPAGPTTAANMGPLCRRHHGFTGHGILTWSIGPPPRPQPLVIELYPHQAPPIHMEHAAA